MASAGARFESARASGDRAAARAAVEDIVSDAKDPAKRAALASSGAAVSIAAELLRAARAACWCDAADATEAADAFLVPFAPLARALRNVCAGNAVARGGACALPRRDAPEALALALPALAARLDGAGTEGASLGSDFSLKKKQEETETNAEVAALAAATQLACNLITGGGAAAETTWRVLFPRHFAAIASLRHRGAAHATHPVLCAAMRARLAGAARETRSDDKNASGDASYDAADDAKVCGFRACAIVWRPLLRASVDRATADSHEENVEANAEDSSSFRGVGGGDALVAFVKTHCLFAGESAPPLCRGLAPLAAETARAKDEALRRKIMGMVVDESTVDESAVREREGSLRTRERFSAEQATLLELVARAAAEAPRSDPSRARGTTETRKSADDDPTKPPATLVLSEGTAAYVLDLASRAAEAVERARADAEAGKSAARDGAEPEPPGEEVSQADAARVTLRACLGVVRALTEREAPPGVAQTPGDDVTSLCAMGMPRLLLGLLASLPVPAGAGNSAKKKARGPSAAPDLDPATFLPFSSAFSGQEQNQDASASASGGGFEPSLKTSLCEGHAPYPSVRPWDGYRVDAMAPLANAMFGRPAVCEAVRALGGVPVLLACTRGEDGDEYLREYALWAVRNVCAGSEEARREIEALQPRAAADAHELAAAGLNVSVDPETGRVRVRNAGGSPRDAERPRASVSVASARGVSRVTDTGGRTRFPDGLMLSGGGERARTPAGRAVQAALEAGYMGKQSAPEGDADDADDAEVPKHWHVADLS